MSKLVFRQACTLLLLGERLQDLPCPERALEALNHDICYNNSYNKWTMQLQLKPEDLDWAINLGRFKTALRMVLQQESDCIHVLGLTLPIAHMCQ